jgi:branched-chain amino acid transport system ATP-binding protein
VFLDEPTAGLTPTETQEMTDFVNRLSESTDITFLITEHDIDVIFSLASRVLVLAEGEIIADGSPKQIQEDSRVRSAYLGEEVEA